MRVFEIRHPEKGVLAEGVEWTNERAVLKTGESSLVSYLSVKEIQRVFIDGNRDYKKAEMIFI